MVEALLQRAKIGRDDESVALTSSALLAGSQPKSLVAETAHAFVYSALQSPLIALAQLTDRRAGGESEEAATFMAPPKRQEFLTDRWLAQQLGGAAGMAIPFLLLHKGVRSVAKLGAISESAT